MDRKFSIEKLRSIEGRASGHLAQRIRESKGEDGVWIVGSMKILERVFFTTECRRTVFSCLPPFHWIPDPREAEPGEGFGVRRGELRHALPHQRECDAQIVGAAAGKLRRAKPRLSGGNPSTRHRG